MGYKKKKTGAVRLIVQISVFALVLFISVGKYLAEKGIALPLASDASLHAICPFGGVVTVYQFAATGDFIQKIHSSSFILMLLVLLTAVLFGAIFCGYICPFGSFQEWIGKIGRKLFPKKYNRFVPRRLDRVLRYLRYAVLAMVVYQTAVTATLIFQSVDPYYALFNFFTGEVAVAAYVVLAVVVVLSLFVERPWCKYLCPYGALLGLFNTMRVFGIRRNKRTCIGCKKCDLACPMNIGVSGSGLIRDHQCISCHKCTSGAACPVEDTVVLAVGKGAVRMKLKARGVEPDPVFCSPASPSAALSSLVYVSKPASSALPASPHTAKNSSTSAVGKFAADKAEDDGVPAYAEDDNAVRRNLTRLRRIGFDPPRLKPAWAAAVTVGILAAGILITSVTGLWSTKSSKTPSKLDGENYSQSYDPADIRGSYTFGEISSLYGIPLGDLADAFGIPEEEASAFKCKDLESVFAQSTYEIGTDSVRMFTAYYLGLPFTPGEDTRLPGTAAQVLTDRGGMTQEQSASLESYTAPAS